MHRVFLDANILFSAAYRDDAGLRKLWGRSGTQLVSSQYAVEEARRNLPAARANDLAKLAARVELIGQLPPLPMPRDVEALPAKDQPIVCAAIAARCDYLLTGDHTHFGPWFGKRIGGVMILRPAEYMAIPVASARRPR